jgi:hypothetical protein
MGWDDFGGRGRERAALANNCEIDHIKKIKPNGVESRFNKGVCLTELTGQSKRSGHHKYKTQKLCRLGNELAMLTSTEFRAGISECFINTMGYIVNMTLSA